MRMPPTYWPIEQFLGCTYRAVYMDYKVKGKNGELIPEIAGGVVMGWIRGSRQEQSTFIDLWSY